jgi:putative aminopeptidase FrvX
MNRDLFLNLAERLMRSLAAPYHEQSVATECVKICGELDLACQPDKYGNLLVTLRTADIPPLILAAHMDHPGFGGLTRTGATTLKAEFRGSVGESYSREGLPLLLMPGRIPARLGKRISEKKEFEIVLEGGALPSDPQFAVWDLADFEIRDQRIFGRACDDLIGVASTLCAIAELKQSNTDVHVIGAITRAEEVGFLGALALAQSGLLPSEGVLISLETSKEIPPIKMRSGVIIRVGDKASTFHSAATRFLVESASELSASDKAFQFQRALMSGGTCEATAYQEFGYTTTAMCIALGNYHNCADRDQIKEEFVDINDALGMIGLLVRVAQNIDRYEELIGRLPARLNAYSKEAMDLLTKRPLVFS